MALKSFKSTSKEDWGIDEKLKPSDLQIAIGCLQRIADSSELSARHIRPLSVIVIVSAIGITPKIKK